MPFTRVSKTRIKSGMNLSKYVEKPMQKPQNADLEKPWQAFYFN